MEIECRIQEIWLCLKKYLGCWWRDSEQEMQFSSLLRWLWSSLALPKVFLFVIVGVPLCYCLCSIVHLYVAVVWNGILKANDLVN